MISGVLPALCTACIWPIVNTDVTPGTACLPQRAGSNSLPDFAQVHVSEGDRLVWGFGDEISTAIRVWLWQMSTQ